MNLMRPSKFAVLALLLANGFFTGAQPSGVSSGTDYPAFRVIADRNIFDPNRYPRTGHESHRRQSLPPSAPAFALVGTMNYQKGMFAFFDGNNPEYRKVLERNGVVAGYTVTEITLHGVKLAAAGKQIEMKIGAQMRQNREGQWEFSDASELPAGTNAVAGTEPATPETPGAGGETSDVLKKLMQQREQELK